MRINFYFICWIVRFYFVNFIGISIKIGGVVFVGVSGGFTSPSLSGFTSPGFWGFRERALVDRVSQTPSFLNFRFIFDWLSAAFFNMFLYRLIVRFSPFGPFSIWFLIFAWRIGDWLSIMVGFFSRASSLLWSWMLEVDGEFYRLVVCFSFVVGNFATVS